VRRLSYQAGATTYTETVRSKADLRDMDGQLVHLHSDYRTVNFSIYFEKVSFFIVFVFRMSVMCSTTEKRENRPQKFENLSILANFGQF
jgi:hypothetical protein